MYRSLACFLPGLRAVAGGLGVGAIYVALTQWQFAANNLWMPLAIPLFLQLPFGLVLGLYMQYSGARRERENFLRITDHLARFVPQEVHQHALDNPTSPALTRHESDVSVLFLDISGFTSISQNLSLAEVSELVETYFSAYLDCLVTGGGDMNETAGDGFMAIFQDMDPREHATRAVQTSLALLAATEQLNAKNEVHPLKIHVGINSGVALVGSARVEGARGSHWTFTATGPVTNLAARLAAASQSGQVFVGPETARRVGDRYPLRCVGKKRYKNVREPVETFVITAFTPMRE